MECLHPRQNSEAQCSATCSSSSHIMCFHVCSVRGSQLQLLCKRRVFGFAHIVAVHCASPEDTASKLKEQ